LWHFSILEQVPGVNLLCFDDQIVFLEADEGFILPNREAICHPALEPGGLDRWMVFDPARPGNQREASARCPAMCWFHAKRGELPYEEM
jgi:hypothetical protein